MPAPSATATDASNPLRRHAEEIVTDDQPTEDLVPERANHGRVHAS